MNILSTKMLANQELVEITPQEIEANDRKTEFLRLLRVHHYRAVACDKLKIPFGKVSEWLDKDPDFLREYDQIREDFYGKTNDKAESTLERRMTKSGKEWIAHAWLQTNHPRWRKANENRSLAIVNLVNFNPDKTGKDFLPDTSGETQDESSK